ncbi:MAG: hypothetical protein ABI843_01920 [Dokdonella sp.]
MAFSNELGAEKVALLLQPAAMDGRNWLCAITGDRINYGFK